MKSYVGIVPSCGVFCGGCPNYIRDKRACPGASRCDRCAGCTSFHLCCVSRGTQYCFQCDIFPCKRLKGFSKRWLKYGQDFIANQRLLAEVGAVEFLKIWNAKVSNEGGA